MQRLHPTPARLPLPAPRDALPQPAVFSSHDVDVAFRLYPFVTSPGRDGLRPCMLKTIRSSPLEEVTSAPALQEFNTFINHVVNGELPPSAHAHIAGASLIAIPKPHNSGLRPIAISSLLRRFISRMLAFRAAATPNLKSYLCPLQLCVGVSGACETIVHATRHVCHSLRNDDYVLLQIDAANAFTNIERQAILDEVITQTHYLARWVHYIYGQPSPLSFGPFIVQSRTGTQQGDPLSLLLFSLALQPLLLDLQRHLCVKFLVFYADDGTIVVRRERAGDVVTYLHIMGPLRGFFINCRKTKAWWFRPPSHIPDFPAVIHRDRTVTVLGAPIGHDDACKHLIRSRRESHDELLTAISSLRDSQLAFHLMRYCASVCKIIYTLRTAPPHLTYAEAESFDLRQRRAFEEFHRPVNDDAWACATLPFKYGGLGLTRSTVLVEAAFLSSVFNGWSLIQRLSHPILATISPCPSIHDTIHPSHATLMSRFAVPLAYSFQSLCQRVQNKGYISHLQDEFTDIIYGRLADSHMPAANTTNRDARLKRARLLSNGSTEVVRVFSSLPNDYLYPHIAPHIWRTMVDWRLGNPIFTPSDCPECALPPSQQPEEAPSTSSQTQPDVDPQEHHDNYCPPQLDPLGYHAVTCRRRLGTTKRHNTVRNLINNMLRCPSIALAPFVEWTFPGQEALPWKRRKRLDLVIDDLTFSPHLSGYDLTIISPHNPQYTRDAATRPGGACTKAEQSKIQKYSRLCTRDNVVFEPLAIDVHGGLGAHAKRAFRQLADVVPMHPLTFCWIQPSCAH